MAEPIRFFMDQHMSGAVTSGLRQHGVEVVSAQDVNRCGAADPDQLAYATAERRVMVTFDTDFLALDGAGTPHAGIAWCEATKFSVGQLIHALLLVHGAMDSDEMQNHVGYL